MSWFGDNFGGIAGAMVGGPLGWVAGNNAQTMLNGGTPGQMMLDSSGRPIPPEYRPSYDKNKQGLQLANNDFLNQLNQEAMRKGPSKSANLMNLESDRQGLLARDNNAQTAGGNAAKARSDLAARGGLSSGARERVEQNANNDVLNLNQKTNQQVQANRAQIGINDEQNRLGQLQSSATMKNQQNVFDIGNQIHEGDQLNAYNQNLYNQNMQAYGANQTANAQLQAAKPGFLGQIFSGIF